MEQCERCQELLELSVLQLIDLFNSLPSRLRLIDGLKPAFFILKSGLASSNLTLKKLAIHALHDVQDLVRESDEYNYNELVDIVWPLVDYGMRGDDIDTCKNASWAAGLLAKQGHSVSLIWDVILSWLDSDNSEKILRAAWILRNCSWANLDISGAISLLEPAMLSENWVTRNYASMAISNEHLRSGKEDTIKVIPEVFELEGLDSDWKVTVYHRRSFGLDDNPFSVPKTTVHFCEHRHCGNCGNPHAVCIWYHDDSGTGWRDRTHEYFCNQCGKYTVYHYFD